MVLAAAAYLSAIAVANYRSMGTGVDLPIFEQSLWNSLRGRWFYSTIEGGSHFGVHFSPVLLLLLPFYAVIPRPETLLISQSLALALAIAPIYSMSRDQLNSRAVGLLLGLAFLVGPAVASVNFDEFHPVAFTVPAFAFAFYYLWRRKFFYFAVALVFALSSKENAPLVGVMLGLYALFVLREKVVGVATMMLSAIWFVLAVLVIIPQFAGHPYAPPGGGFSYLGKDMVNIVTGLMSQPGIAVAEMTQSAKLSYVYWLLFPVAFLPLLAPEVLLIAAPILVQNLLSRYVWNYFVFRRYVAMLVPFLYLATVFALERTGRVIWPVQWRATRRGRSRTFLVYGLTLCILTLSVRASSALGLFPPRWSVKSSEHIRAAEGLHQIIPADGSLAANHDHLSQLARREGIYMLTQWRQADYVLIDLKSRWSHLSIEERRGLIESLEAASDYQRLSSWDQMFLYVRSERLKADSAYYVAVLEDPKAPLWRWSFNNQARVLGADLANDRYHPGEGIDLTLYWQALAPTSIDYNVFVHLIGPDGQLVAQDNKAPQGGARPTGAWSTDEIVPDRFATVLPWDAPIGSYKISVGLYQRQTGERLPLLNEYGSAVGDSLTVATVDVRER